MTEESKAKAQDVIRVTLLGAFHAELASGEIVRLSSEKTKGLLAYLLLAPGMRHTREHLAALLWDRSDSEHARASLRQALASLRKAFPDSAGPYILNGDAAVVRLNPALFRTDIDALKEGLLAPEDAGEFLESLNICSEPFEEWKRSKAAEITPLVRRGKETPEHPALKPAIGTTGVNSEVALVQPPSFMKDARLLVGALGVCALAFLVIGQLGGTRAYDKPIAHGQNSTDLTRQAEIFRTQPDLTREINTCKYDREKSAHVIAACTTILESVEKNEPYRPVAFTIRGTAHRWEGDFELAKQDFIQAVAADERYYNAHHGLAYTYFLTGEYDHALEHYGRVREILPVHFMALYRTGEVYFETAQYQNAVKTFTQAITENPDYAAAYYFRALSHERLGAVEAAKSDLKMAASLNSSLRTEAEQRYIRLSAKASP